MGKLNYDELILLDSFIYLEWSAVEDKPFINVVYDLMKAENFPENIEIMGDCSMNLERSECIKMFEQIINKHSFRKLKIKDISSNENGVKCACFMDDENNVTVVFKGTVSKSEWNDNGAGAYEYTTKEQIDALNYINGLKYNNITVTGHSKGGNKAQYVAILSPKVSECISVNGQGFSNEFMNMYNVDINKNKFKITSINAKYDYVSCLFNSIAGKEHYIETEIQLNPFDYHKASILLDDNGKLRKETSEAKFSKIINGFSQAVITDLPGDIKSFVTNKIINVIELILCKKENKNDPLKVAGEILIMLYNESNLKFFDIFRMTYPILELLILPLLFWNDFIEIEENSSKELLVSTINNIDILGHEIIKKMEFIDADKIEIINGILKEFDNLIDDLKNEI
ncbi:Mbeg1-like protein [uncultured Clostridium sp.]|uniref:Mbeg1-like protein n=1 Tax=uncultured Clostridium sp. TaxID=59620 RepID=UPI0028EA3A93|nr:Mbeg1-like protein [uncultured Clostridium sp.]